VGIEMAEDSSHPHKVTSDINLVPSSFAARANAEAPQNAEGPQALILAISVFLKRICKIKAENNCDFDDIIILVACGLINFYHLQGETPIVQPANISSIADCICMSRETVRRRLRAMEQRDFVRRYPTGYVISTAARWQNLMELLNSAPSYEKKALTTAIA
jgi:hypothetical protein